jgi:NAD(P)-dependent dehydrogenase (short-subunit alcohol dehydrogenase family)
MQRLGDRGALVTGGANGIGTSVARRLAAEGAVVTVVDIDVDGGNRCVSRIVDAGGRATFVQADVADWAAIDTAVSRAVEFASDLSVLVNCAQYFPAPKAFEVVAQRDWELSEATGPKATFRFMQLAYPHLRTSGHGSVINFTSGAAVEGIRFTAPYASAKAGILALSRVAANEWSRQGVRVNVLSPFAVTSVQPQADNSQPSILDLIVAQSPMGRGGDPELDVAPVVAFLASDDAAFITGTVVSSDGGLTELSPIDYSDSPGVFEDSASTATS